MKKNILTLLLPFIIVGCATGPKTQYYWGSYPSQTYLMYSNAGKASPAEQIASLEKDIQKAKSKNMAVAPGIYAHLGLMYLEESNLSKAEQYFEIEKQLYPESTIFIDRLLKKNVQQGSQK